MNISSMEAPSHLHEPPWLASWPRELPDQVLQHCPPYVRNTVEDLMVATSASPEALTAVALATMASALGPNVRVQTPLGDPVPAMYNLAVCHKASQTQPWFDHLVYPLLSFVYTMQLSLNRNGIQLTRQILEGFEHDLEKANVSSGVGKDTIARMEQAVANTRATLKPNIAAGSLSCRIIGKLVPQAFDGGLTVFKLGSDPGEELFRVKNAERTRIIDALNRSWTGAPLMMDGDTSPGTISLLLQTHRSPGDLLGGNGFDPELGAVPVLIFAEKSRPSLNPLSPLAHQKEWARILQIILDRRCKTDAPVVFTMDEEAETVMHRFCDQIEQRNIPVEYHCHVAWFPDLVRRLALLLSMLSEEKNLHAEINATCTENAATLAWWFARQHLCSVIEDIGKAEATAGTVRTDKTAMMLKKITAKGPLSRRELWRSFDNPRADWFNAALESLLAAGQVRENEQKTLVACQ